MSAYSVVPMGDRLGAAMPHTSAPNAASAQTPAQPAPAAPQPPHSDAHQRHGTSHRLRHNHSEIGSLPIAGRAVLHRPAVRGGGASLEYARREFAKSSAVVSDDGHVRRAARVLSAIRIWIDQIAGEPSVRDEPLRTPLGELDNEATHDPASDHDSALDQAPRLDNPDDTTLSTRLSLAVMMTSAEKSTDDSGHRMGYNASLMDGTITEGTRSGSDARGIPAAPLSGRGPTGIGSISSAHKRRDARRIPVWPFPIAVVVIPLVVVSVIWLTHHT